VFLPVGSQGTVKALIPEEIKDAGLGMLLANTYHLYLRPGLDVIGKFGGLHRFMGWDGAILTDSGGYQIFSLAPLRKVSDEGVVFRSHIDGSEHHFTPELAIKYQEVLGADVIMALDECPAHDETPAKIEAAMERTHRWAERCLRAQTRPDQALFGIVQGGVIPELRRRSAEYLTSLGFSGYAIGGLSLGEPKAVTYDIVAGTTAHLPADKPRYLMGVGSPEDVVTAVGLGVDIFDCVLPTRVARNGALFTWEGRRNIRNAVYSEMAGPVMPGCGCYTCRKFSAAYLHHLFDREELLAYRLATIHNLSFMAGLMERTRTSIREGAFAAFRDSFLTRYRATDEEVRLSQKQKWLKARRG
jgi:queuine tRNA-ribosyltransferase